MDVPVWLTAIVTLLLMYAIYSVRKFNLQMRIREGLQVKYVEKFEGEMEEEEEEEPTDASAPKEEEEEGSVEEKEVQVPDQKQQQEEETTQ
jgi:hypothetical protein